MTASGRAGLGGSGPPAGRGSGRREISAARATRAGGRDQFQFMVKPTTPKDGFACQRRSPSLFRCAELDRKCVGSEAPRNRSSKKGPAAAPRPPGAGRRFDRASYAGFTLTALGLPFFGSILLSKDTF